MVSIMVEAVATRAWEGAGIASPAVWLAWLAWQTGLSPERARQVATMARRKDQLPETFIRFEQGLRSIDQVAGIAFRTQFIPPATGPDPAQPDPESAHWFAAGWDDDGTVHLRGNADSIDGSVILNASREAEDALFRGGDIRATWLDVLVEECARSLGTLTTKSRRDLYRAAIHLDTEGARMHKGGPVPRALLATFLCDGQVRPVWTTGELPVNIGRSQHNVCLHTRILVENRHRMCRKPTCAATLGQEVHHIVHWAPPDSGLSDAPNLVCLCRRDHTACHGRGAARPTEHP